MMTFEEEFPSLKEHICKLEMDNPHIHLKIIEKTCLDKERVRKALQKCETILYEFSDGGGIKGINKVDLWSELDL
jgi:hypothetical protein